MSKLKEKITKVVDFTINSKIVIAVLLLLSVLLRWHFMKDMSIDFNNFLDPWFNTLKEAGGIRGINYYQGDYAAIYVFILALLTYIPIDCLFSIKIFSIIFEYMSCFVIYKILEHITEKKGLSRFIATLTLFLPTVVLNGSWWAQSDGIYTFFVLLTILMFLKEKENWAFIAYGAALAIKLQAIFVLPAIIIYYVGKRKLPFKLFISFVVLAIPNLLIFGNPIGPYLTQVGEYSDLVTLNMSNYYWLLKIGDLPGESLSDKLFGINNIEMMQYTLILITMFIFALIAFGAFARKVKFTDKGFLKLCAMSVMICVYLLPSMHDRYLYMADILTFVLLAISFKKGIYTALTINGVSILSYIVYMGTPVNSYVNLVFSVLYLIAAIIISCDVVKNDMGIDGSEDEERKERIKAKKEAKKKLKEA